MEGDFVMKVLSTRRIYEGRILNVRIDELELANGNRATFEIVEHNEGVCIVAQPEPDSIVLVRQYRPATGRTLLEVPAGKLETGEDAAVCARRELAEETGYRCAGVTKAWSFYPAPGFCSEFLHLFIASGLTAGTPHPEQDEDISVEVKRVADAWAMIQNGEIIDAKTQIALAYVGSMRGLI
jgi:ADP-ribose pyrophosphatase